MIWATVTILYFYEGSVYFFVTFYAFPKEEYKKPPVAQNGRFRILYFWAGSKFYTFGTSVAQSEIEKHGFYTFTKVLSFSTIYCPQRELHGTFHAIVGWNKNTQ